MTPLKFISILIIFTLMGYELITWTWSKSLQNSGYQIENEENGTLNISEGHVINQLRTDDIKNALDRIQDKENQWFLEPLESSKKTVIVDSLVQKAQQVPLSTFNDWLDQNFSRLASDPEKFFAQISDFNSNSKEDLGKILARTQKSFVT